MGSKNRNKAKGTPNQPNVQRATTPTVAVAPQEAPVTEGRLKKTFKWLLAVGALTTAINIGLVITSCVQVQIANENIRVSEGQLKVAKDTLDRSTGRVTAKYTIADCQPTPDAFREDQKTVIFGLKDRPAPYFKDANSIVLKPPTLYLNNLGTEPIDAVRVETSFRRGIIDRLVDGIDAIKLPPPADWHKVDTPVLLRKVEKEEHVLTQQWMPGKSLRVPVLRGVLAQLRQVQSRNQVDRLHFAQLEINVSARITGSSVFTSEGSTIVYAVVWLPKGFPEDEYTRILDNYQPRLEVGPLVRDRLPTQSEDPFRLIDEQPTYAYPKSIEPNK